MLWKKRYRLTSQNGKTYVFLINSRKGMLLDETEKCPFYQL